MTAHPPTLVDLAARDEECASACRCVLPDEGLIPCRACRDLLPLLRGAAPRLLAELRALPRYELTYGNLRDSSMLADPDGDWIKVSDLRALLGEEQ